MSITIGNYRLLDPIGEGGMGKVYLAEHTLLGRRAAVKVLHAEHASRQEIVQRFFTEARAASSLQDPGIVQIFDFGFHEDVAYIVMEYLEGESLAGRLQRLGCISAVEALRLVYQIALSLHTAHARGVIHRDLKPDNIVVIPDPAIPGGERTKVLDFGIAKLADPVDANRVRTQTGAVIGTPVYMSPEQCKGAGEIDHRSDIYSLGCVLFHLVCGRPPFDAEGAGSLIVMHVRDAPPVPSTLAPVSAELDAIVLRCLAKEPGDRYQTMHELALAIDGVLRTYTPGQGAAYETSLPVARTFIKYPTTLSSAVGEVPPTEVPPVAAPRSRWPLIAAIVLVLVGGGIAGTVAMTGSSTTGALQPAASASPADVASDPAPPTPPAAPPAAPAVTPSAGSATVAAKPAVEAPPKPAVVTPPKPAIKPAHPRHATRTTPHDPKPPDDDPYADR